MFCPQSGASVESETFSSACKVAQTFPSTNPPTVLAISLDQRLIKVFKCLALDDQYGFLTLVEEPVINIIGDDERYWILTVNIGIGRLNPCDLARCHPVAPIDKRSYNV